MHGKPFTHRIAPLAFVMAMALVFACTDPAGPDTTPKEIVLTSVDTLRSIGETVALKAAIRNSGSEPIPGAVVTWVSTDPTILSVNATTGLATAVANGAAYVRARSADAVDSVRIVVRQRINRDRSTLSVGRRLSWVGDTVGITLTLRDALGNRIPFGGADVFITRSGGTAGGRLLQAVDRGDGTYTSGFIGSSPGTTAEVTALINGEMITTPSPTMTVTGFTKVGVTGGGTQLTCGMLTTGDLYCWGQQNNGVRGTGVLNAGTAAPTLVTGGHKWSDFSIGTRGVCGIVENAKLYCWGNAFNGTLGNGARSGLFPTPVAVLPDSSFMAVHLAISEGACGITTGHTALCWAAGESGRIGDGADTTVYTPVAVKGGYRFAAISTSISGTCGVTDAGAAICWGDWDSTGEFPPSPEVCRFQTPCTKLPVAVPGGISFKPIIAHDSQEVCAVGTDSKTYCWGRYTFQPIVLPTPLIFTSLVVSNNDRCGMALTGGPYCWGFNVSGRFGSPPDFGEHKVPELIVSDIAFTQVSMAPSHMCGVAEDGRAWCWGSNDFGELGDGSTNPSAIPVRVELNLQ